MASSGWQNEQTWYTYSNNVRLIGNIYISAITHSGTNLRIQGQIAGGARGSSGFYFHFNDYTSYAQPEGGSKLALGSKGKTWKVGDADEHVNFDVTLTNVQASDTSREFSVNFYGPNTNSVVATLKWTLSFDASGVAPSGGYITYNSSTDSSVNVTSGVTSWGGLTGGIQALVVTGSSNGEASSITAGNWELYGRRKVQWDNIPVTTMSQTGDITSGNSVSIASPIEIKGMLHYKLAYYNTNVAGISSGLEDQLRYLPPSVSKFTYTDPGGDGTKDYPVVFTGIADNNHTTYDTANLTRTVRYKVNNAGSWTYVVQDSQALIGANTSFTVRIPGGQSAVIEGWQTYHGMQSEMKTLNLYNGNAPSRAYGPVDGKSKLAVKCYGPVNKKSKNIIKLYGSVNGKARAILG